MIRTGEAEQELHSFLPSLGITVFLGNFQCVESIKSAERLAEYLMDANARVGWKMSNIISHVVDSTTNVVAGTKEMKFQTKIERPHDMYMRKCMPHKASTPAMTASGNSDHVDNLNPEAGEILKNVIVYRSISIGNVPGVTQWRRYTRRKSVVSILPFNPE